ncbi:MAG: hypothetical protein H0T62_00950 [Parachlamydiaceae bacterium]|nr:hypothetical protein [Parachlamydiaceae bacterium]
MKKWTSLLFLIFSINCCLVFSNEKDFYQTNIEKTLNACKVEPSQREEIRELFLQIYRVEKAHPDHIQCLTAQDSLFYAYQVIAKELYRKLFGQTKEEFEFLRFPSQNLIKTREEFFSRFPMTLTHEELAKEFRTTPDNLNEAIKANEIHHEENCLRISMGEDEVRYDFEDHDDFDDDDDDDEEDLENVESPSKFQLLNDTVPEVSKELLSVNFTMETYCPQDSTMAVFLSGCSVSLSSLSDDEEAYEKRVSKIFYELFDFLSFPREKLSICIENLIKRAPHTSRGIINQIFLPKKNIVNFLYLSFGGGWRHPIYDSNFEESYSEFQHNRKGGSFRTFRNFQARIIAGSLFDDPQVKIFRYTLIPQEEQKQYEAIVRDEIDKLFHPD